MSHQSSYPYGGISMGMPDNAHADATIAAAGMTTTNGVSTILPPKIPAKDQITALSMMAYNAGR
jgi:hypothetical protein